MLRKLLIFLIITLLNSRSGYQMPFPKCGCYLLLHFFLYTKTSLHEIPKFAVSRLLRWINFGKKCTVKVILCLRRFFSSSLRTLEREDIIFCVSIEVKWFHVAFSDWLIVPTRLSKSELFLVLNRQLWIKPWASRKLLRFSRRTPTMIMPFSSL